MHTKTYEQLEHLASDIILQDAHTKEDAKELSKIKYFMSLIYKKTNDAGSASEANYNELRAKHTVDLQNTGMAVGKAENEAKAKAEEEHGDYRTKNAEAQGINKVMDSLNGFIISTNVELKQLDNLSV